jgi:hypothetical protein
MEDEDELIEKEFEKEQKGGLRTFFAVVLMTIDMAIVRNTQIGGSVFVLMITSHDCDEPLRIWISVLAAIMAFHALFLLATEILAVGFRQKPGIGSVSFAVNTLVHSFLFLWMLVGMVWTYNDSSECKDDFYEGWMLASIIFMVYFGVFALIFVGLVLITLITCLGSWHISSYMQKEVED